MRAEFQGQALYVDSRGHVAFAIGPKACTPEDAERGLVEWCIELDSMVEKEEVQG
jgi:hypothetical protein